ncbi:MAG TPA: hypothetical protein VH112_01835, partial [Acidimicrobiales bacterium]|nr:hypothetical protein [Acidimicrobiales bacterium]
AAEVALGILSGPERADALGHLEHCVGCRVRVEGLAQTGDSLLLLAPEVDPPMGFESRVAARVNGQADRAEAPPDVQTPGNGDDTVVELGAHTGPRPIRPKPSARRARTLRRRRTALAAAAAVTVLVGGTATAVTVLDHTGSSDHTQVADQTTLRSGHFQAADGRPVGRVYAYSGDPSWVFMNVDASGANGTYTCQLELTNGTTVPLGQFDVHDGIGEWAHTVGVDVSHIKAAKLVTPAGVTLATANVS